MEIKAVCPHCNKPIKLILNEDAIKIEGVSFDIRPETLVEKLKEAGYEFGQEGGE